VIDGVREAAGQRQMCRGEGGEAVRLDAVRVVRDHHAVRRGEHAAGEFRQPVAEVAEFVEHRRINHPRPPS
jgi:hypothetical protein